MSIYSLEHCRISRKSTVVIVLRHRAYHWPRCPLLLTADLAALSNVCLAHATQTALYTILWQHRSQRWGTGWRSKRKSGNRTESDRPIYERFLIVPAIYQLWTLDIRNWIKRCNNIAMQTSASIRTTSTPSHASPWLRAPTASTICPHLNMSSSATWTIGTYSVREPNRLSVYHNFDKLCPPCSINAKNKMRHRGLAIAPTILRTKSKTDLP